MQKFKTGKHRKAAQVAKAARKRADQRTLAHTDHLVWLSIAQAAAWYQVSETTVRRRVNDGTYASRLSPDAKTRQVRRDGV